MSEATFSGQSIPDDVSGYSQMAGKFLSMMDEMAPQLRLDYSVESLQRLDQFITECFEPIGERQIEESLVQGVGCYLGEVIIRQLDGEWSENGEAEVLWDFEGLEPVRPLEKAQKRFMNGKPDSLAWFYYAIHKKVAETDLLDHVSPQRGFVGNHQRMETGQDGSGFFGAVKQILGKVIGKH